MGAILLAKTFKVKKLWHNSFNNHAKLLTKDQNKGCVQRNHPENMLLKKKKIQRCICESKCKQTKYIFT